MSDGIPLPEELKDERIILGFLIVSIFAFLNLFLALLKEISWGLRPIVELVIFLLVIFVFGCMFALFWIAIDMHRQRRKMPYRYDFNKSE